MEEHFLSALSDLWARTQGPMWIRLVLQPAVAVFFGVRAGLKNARDAAEAGDFPDADHRARMRRQGWKDVGVVAIAGGLLDLVFQWMVLHAIHPIETLVVVLVIVLLPYHIVRTVVARVARRRSSTP